MVKRLSIVLVWLFVSAFSSFAQDLDEETSPAQSKRHHFGVRLGTWINLGDSAFTDIVFIDEFDNIVAEMETNINDVNFHFEGYFAYNLFPQTYVEFSVGIVNRGSVTIQDQFSTDIGNLILYPFLLQLKYYPFSATSRLQPYFAAGGGIYYGRQDIQFTTSLFNDPFLQGDSETDFNYTLSGGVDYILSRNWALDFNVKYMPIDFPDGLILMRDYDALAISVGVKYLYGGKK